jgi:hypothetical protein
LLSPLAAGGFDGWSPTPVIGFAGDASFFIPIAGATSDGEAEVGAGAALLFAVFRLLLAV